MEMIMSLSTTAERSGQVGGGTLTRFANATKRLFVAYMTWRMEQSAIAVLRSMSDQELIDIGLSRADIPGAVHREGPDDRFHPGAALSLR
jgi:uncharacterized protein YjiS (DUF1127 family)